MLSEPRRPARRPPASTRAARSRLAGLALHSAWFSPVRLPRFGEVLVESLHDRSQRNAERAPAPRPAPSRQPTGRSIAPRGARSAFRVVLSGAPAEGWRSPTRVTPRSKPTECWSEPPAPSRQQRCFLVIFGFDLPEGCVQKDVVEDF